MGDTYIINKTGDKVAQAIENALQIDDKLSEQKIIIDQEIQRVESIAKGRATGYVFDTKEDMDEWLSNENNCSTLVLGDNFYIRDLKFESFHLIYKL